MARSKQTPDVVEEVEEELAEAAVDVAKPRSTKVGVNSTFASRAKERGKNKRVDSSAAESK
jgi:tRNA(Ser,Leu) C12 N-acetylase TAN1